MKILNIVIKNREIAMKIKKIELQNHSFFGNQEFVFTKSNGDLYDNIVLAGENGSGKTQLLNIIYEFCNLSLTGEVNTEKRIFTVVLSAEELRYVTEHVRESIKPINPTGEFEITQDFTAQSNTWNRIKVKYEKIEDDGSRSMQEIESSWFFNDINRATLFRSIFSTVEINYDPKEAKSVTAKEVDAEIEKSIRSGTDLATEIQQLLIDIKANDASDLDLWVEEHDGEVPPANVKNKRINRFKNAFATVFQNLNFYKIVNDGNNKKVLFKKDTHEVEISALSSGEKQIVFRGAFLLQNQQSSKGCCILIDEPEISLHPIWQGKIFDYYRNLFIDDTGIQTSQIFTATHSQYVLKSALDNSANTLILLLKNSSGTLEISHIQAPLVLPSLTSAEINYVAFDLVSNDYHIELYGYLQNKIAHARGTTECSVLDCDRYIVQQTDYDATKHYKLSSHTHSNGHVTQYSTLSTYVRNLIDHPDPVRRVTPEELRTSIELLIKLCR